MDTLTTRAGDAFDRAPFESLLKRRLFFTEAFEIYRKAPNFKGDNKGLYDYGPPGCSLQANIVDIWRKHFVIEEQMLELDCTILTPEDVFKTSGHVDKFADWMCKDIEKGDYLRADHLIERVLDGRLKGDQAAGVHAIDEREDVSEANAKEKKPKVKAIGAVKLNDTTVKRYEEILARMDNYSGEELGDMIKRLDIRNPDGGSEVHPPVPFNLMFKTTIGPSSASPGYLRPETAQGQFVNFKKLLDFNQGSMPFASASIGKSFRNEISPRSGVLRVREFLMAEVEHFVDPEGGQKHERFFEVENMELPLLDRDTQLAGHTNVRRVRLAEAVNKRIIDSETLAYFLARTQLFLEKIGADLIKIRFRQHMANEMAHYAADCWDTELLTSYGWIECSGCADRSAYDLSVHANRTGQPLVVRENFLKPRKVDEWQVELDKKQLGPKFKKHAQAVVAAVEMLGQAERQSLAATLKAVGKIEITVPGLPEDGKVMLDQELLTIERRTRLETVREYVPNVIEPSFGIGRILYSVLEHVYWHRADDIAREVLSLPPMVAPIKVLIVPLSSNSNFTPLVRKLTQRFRTLGITNRVDSSTVSIGKRYSRNDELGTPLGVTVDFDSVKDNTVTLRDRDSMQQVRASVPNVEQAIKSLINGHEIWADVFKRLPPFLAQGRDDI